MVTIEERSELYGGGVEDKYYLAALIHSSAGEGRTTHLFEKVMPPKAIGHSVQAWKEHKAAGIPVVPFLRTTDTSLVMPDMREVGYECYGQGLVYWAQDDEMPRGRVVQDDMFLELVEGRGLQIIEDRAAQYADRATAQEILLADDVPFELLVHESGEWDIFALDLGESKLHRNMRGLKEKNRRHAEALMPYLRFLRMYLPDWKE